MMTYCSVYIGDLDDPGFRIDEVMTINLPRALCACFPPPREHYNLLFHRWVKERGIQCTKTDYSGWVVQARKDELLDYVEFVYGSDPAYTVSERIQAWEVSRKAVERLNEIRIFITTLDPHSRYALVAECD